MTMLKGRFLVQGDRGFPAIVQYDWVFPQRLRSSRCQMFLIRSVQRSGNVSAFDSCFVVGQWLIAEKQINGV